MEQELLPIDWYIMPPIDFEHKQYILMAYLKIVDDSFMKKMLSPHYLYLEKLENELYEFINIYEITKKELNKNKYIYFEDTKLYGLENSNIDEIIDIVEYSIPQLSSRILTGKIILTRNKQVLY